MTFYKELKQSEDAIKRVRVVVIYLNHVMKGGERNRTALGRLMHYGSKGISKDAVKGYQSARDELKRHFNSIAKNFREDKLRELLKSLREIYDFGRKCASHDRNVRFVYGIVKVSKHFDRDYRRSNINQFVKELREFYNNLSHGKVSHFISICARSGNRDIVTLAHRANKELHEMQDNLEYAVKHLMPLTLK